LNNSAQTISSTNIGWGNRKQNRLKQYLFYFLFYMFKCFAIHIINMGAQFYIENLYKLNCEDISNYLTNSQTLVHFKPFYIGKELKTINYEKYYSTF
jgi:hypothetical protein